MLRPTPAAPSPSPSMSPKARQLTSSPRPRAEQLTSSPGPRAEQLTSSPGPRAEQLTSSPGPRAEQLTSSPGPRAEQLTSSLGPRAEKRTRNRIALAGAFALSTLVVVACQTTDTGPKPVSPAVSGGAKSPREAPTPLGGETLAGETIERTTNGAWETRASTSTGGGGGAGGGKGRMMEMEGASAPMEDSSVERMHGADRAPPPPPAAPRRKTAPAKSGRSLAMPGAVVVPQNPLKAGSTDDNASFPEFLTFLDGWKASNGDDYLVSLDVSDRRRIEVVDVAGTPVPGAKVEILDASTEALLWRATTFGDGIAPLYPKVLPTAAAAHSAGRQWAGNEVLVLVDKEGANTSVKWDSKSNVLNVTLPDAPALPQVVPIDVTFLIDTTGSMADEIERIRTSLLKVTERVRGLRNGVRLRYGAVLYRDLGDAYVTSRHAFTDDVAAFDAALQEVSAGGGGDFPESLNQGLLVAIDQMAWRPDAAKVVFLIADAPPHMDYQGDVPYQTSAVRAVENGVRVHAVAASGLNPMGTLVMRQVAQATRGKFIFIEYGKPGETAKSHGVANPSSSNNLDDILFHQIRDEVEGFGTKR